MKRKITIIMISSILLVSTIIGVFIYYKPHRSVKREAAAYSLSVSQLVNEFSQDETKANSRYLGNILEVRGTLKEIILNDSSLVLLLGDSMQNMGVSCYLLKDQKNVYPTLKRGEPVNVKGICNGMLLDIVLDKCIMLPEK